MFMTTLSSYLTVENNLSRWQTMTADTPSVALATQYYKANIGNATSIDQFLNNTRLYNYAMTAFGLGSQASYYKGLMKQVLEQGVSSTSSLAYTLNDSRILAFAQAFNFAADGASTTQSSAVQTNVVSQYINQSLDSTQGQQNPGVQLALYFQQNASSITNAYDILANKNLLTVVQTALGMSPYTSLEPLDEQAQQITSKINFSDFQNPTKLQTFIEQFCAMYDENNSSASGSGSGSSSPPANAILASATGSAGISTSLLLSIQSLQPGGT
jgi:hypothetical protein